MYKRRISENNYAPSYHKSISYVLKLTSMVIATSSSDKSDTSVLPCVILGSPSGPVNEVSCYVVDTSILYTMAKST